jgi:hypothetical protein
MFKGREKDETRPWAAKQPKGGRGGPGRSKRERENERGREERVGGKTLERRKG